MAPLDARVLEVLAGTTRPLSGREVARIAGQGSPNGVWRALNRLAASGIVHADRRGRAIYYVANRDHLAWPAIETLAHLRGRLFRRLADEIAAWSIAPLHASVFGSVSRGDADADSDLDLLIVRPEGLDAEARETWERQLDALRERILRWTGNRTQTFSIEQSRLIDHVRAGDPLVRSWLDDEIPLFGPPIRDLVQVAR